MKKSNFPDILIEQEELILSERLDSLTPSDLLEAFTAWPEFKKQRTVQDAIQDKEVMAAVEKDLRSLN